MKISLPASKAGMIMVFDEVISPEHCKQFIDEIKPYWSQLSSPGRTMGGIDVKTKNSEDIAFSSLGFSEKTLNYPQSLNDLEQIFLNGFFQTISYYINEYKSLHSWLEIRDTGFQVQKYSKCNG